MPYNALKFSHDDGDRAQYFQAVFYAVNPDIIIMQEIVDEGGADTLLNIKGDGALILDIKD